MEATRTLAVMLATVGFSGTANAASEMVALSWLSGCWASEGGEQGSGETWTSLAGGTMLGVSRTVKSGKTVEYEFMELRHLPDGRLAFIAHPSGQRTTVFPVLRISASEVVFENPQHDFPQRVAYAREGDSRLRARIEGIREGTPRVIEFPMSRVACGSRQIAAAG